MSPCVLPLVPAYLGQLTAVAVAAQGTSTSPSRWAAVRHAVTYVAGFGSVFTLLGITATFAGGVLADYLPALRVVGGVVLVVMGLSLAGILRIPVLERTWRPLDAGASAGLTTMTGGMTLAPAGGGTADSVGIPFIVIAAFYDRSKRLVRFLVRHGRTVSLVGGLLVAAIGLAMIFDLLILLPRYFG